MWKWLKRQFNSLFVRRMTFEEVVSHPNFGATTLAKPRLTPQDEDLIKTVETALRNGRTCPTCGKDGFDGTYRKEF